MYIGIRSFLSKIILLLLIPTILAQPLYGWHNQVSVERGSYQDPLNASALITYDQVVQYLADMESGAVESRCSTKDLECINPWLIANFKGKAKSPLCIRFSLKGACSLFRK